MHNWPQQLQALSATQSQAVLVTVAGIRGSAPREIGSNMIVTEAEVTGTIGGGYLENECIRLACAALRDVDGVPARKLRRFALGSQCGQCCGGVVDVLFERLALDDAPWIDALVDVQQSGQRAVLVTEVATGDGVTKWVVSEDDNQASERYSLTHVDAQSVIGSNAAAAALMLLRDQQPAVSRELRRRDGSKSKYLFEPIGPAPLSIVLFGAGHVGTACAAVFGTLDATVMVVDSRADYLDADWPANATPVLATEPERIVAHCPANSYYLVMTHDHAIDLVLCQAILARDDRAFCGLIGSRSKQRRFEKKLRAAGIDEATLATLTCPIGIDSIGGKQPGEIAIATAAQIVAHHQQRLSAKAEANAQRDAVMMRARSSTRGTDTVDSPPGDSYPMQTTRQHRNLPRKPQAR